MTRRLGSRRTGRLAFRRERAATAVSPSTWSRVPDVEEVFGGDNVQKMLSVTAGGPGVVAVGLEGSGNDLDAAVWISTDGITWFRVPHDRAVFGGDGAQQMLSVTAAGPGLVAVGAESLNNDLDVAVWTSPDGI